MKARGVLLLVCLSACGGGNQRGVTDATPETVPAADVADVASDTMPLYDTHDTSPPPDVPDILDTTDTDIPCIPDCDGKECGDDGCGGSCGGCVDEDPCNGEETCEDNQCVEGTALECDDENPCTTDSCIEGEGCKNVPVPDKAEPACDDGNPCTNDECVSGECKNFLKDPEELVVEDCLCESDEDCEPLEDGDLCNGTLICDVEAEVPTCMVDEETVVTCTLPEDVAPECNTPVCDPDTGSCTIGTINEDGLCSDSDECTQGDHCQAGSCNADGPVECGDSNPCTDDSCDPATGCVNSPNTDECNDGEGCTHSDTCLEGVCSGIQYSCDDPAQCETADGATCNGDGTCTYLTAPMNGTPCDDSDACTQDGACAGGACIGGNGVDCDDANDCTDDACDPLTGCTHTNNSAGCSDDDPCTTGDYCDNGACVTLGTLDCDDANDCTDDTCVAGVGCDHVPGNEGGVCQDDVGICLSGACCVPDCEGQDCGDDGCGGICGACEEHYTCEDGTCVYQPWCGDGTCDVALLEDCSTCLVDCPCGCGETCDAGICTFTACNGKDCGDDGCGGSCGICGNGEACQNGQCVVVNTWTDPTSDLTWQVTPTGGEMHWSDAKTHCAGLSLDGGGWHLPSISELRTLIRGCPGTVTGGACGVTDMCLNYSSCYDVGGCTDCPWLSGPADGCYWPDEMQGTCSCYWSSSLESTYVHSAWIVYFNEGDVDIDAIYWLFTPVRCVR